MPFPETYSALQNGAIDAQENPNPTSWNMKFHEVQSHVTMTYHGNLDQVILVNLPWWNSLTDDCRAAMTEAVAAGSDVTLSETLKQEEAAMADFLAAGVEIVEVSDEDRMVMQEAVLPPVLDFYLKTNGDRGQAILDMFEAEIAAGM